MSKIDIDLAAMWSVIEEVISSGGEFRLFPRGTSMMPLIREGKDSVALVLPKDIKKGDIVLYKRSNGQFVLHRVVKIKNGEYLMCGDNQYTVEHGIKKDDILAVVGRIFRDESEIPKDSPGYARYISSLPSRRLKKRIRAKLSAVKRRIIKKKSEEQ